MIQTIEKNENESNYKNLNQFDIDGELDNNKFCYDEQDEGEQKEYYSEKAQENQFFFQENNMNYYVDKENMKKFDRYEDQKLNEEFNNMNDQQRNHIIAQYKTNFQQNPDLHTGISLKYLNCNKLQEKKTVYIKNESKFRSILKYFDSRCDYTIKNELTPDVDFIYSGTYSDVRENHKQGQIVSKIPKIKSLISEKDKFDKLLKKFDRQHLFNFTSNSFHFKSFEFNLDSPNYNKEEQSFMKDVNKGFWVAKDPSGKSKNRLTIYNSPQAIKDVVSKMKYKSKFQDTLENYDELLQNNIKFSYVEEYMKNPFLWDNKKIDHTGFVLIANQDPLVVLYQDGFVKKCIENYDNQLKKFDQKAIFKHITNRKLYKGKHPYFEQQEDDLVITVPELKEYLIKNYNFNEEKFQYLQEQKHRMVAYSVMAIKDKLPVFTGAYQLLGLNFIWDENFKIKMIEFDTFPQLSGNLSAQKFVYPTLVQSTLDLMLDTLSEPEKTQEKWQNPENLELGNWEIVINEAQSYNVLDKYKIEK
ncbi:hypothetical protein PPERSA_07500 [Pseudocohnilembus persalinus]|uniref:Tubulin-tyrosine ligase family protein n=1 Tax=Pseudocohnilembus persalinus TaxID=266149 RepID=A0A0V0QZN8_PSEPJ|nr:hypothetical protein PPERSA_07500 [Pseudocohnilembus persalinus]|eukprot:KRX07750.1 hypothetical protein PPERSA_07500 [Pseudocohnilembus persalinus]